MTCPACPHEVCGECKVKVHCETCHFLRCECPAQRENKFLHYDKVGEPVWKVRVR